VFRCFDLYFGKIFRFQFANISKIAETVNKVQSILFIFTKSLFLLQKA